LNEVTEAARVSQCIYRGRVEDLYFFIPQNCKHDGQRSGGLAFAVSLELVQSNALDDDLSGKIARAEQF
jgi:hypothetical protein